MYVDTNVVPLDRSIEIRLSDGLSVLFVIVVIFFIVLRLFILIAVSSLASTRAVSAARLS